MYEIILTTWYQETPKITYLEVYNGLGFKEMEDATKYLGENIDEILDNHPVDGQIMIKYNNKRKSALKDNDR